MAGKYLHSPSPAMAVALTALLVALCGSAYAAISLPANSVGTKQLKNGAVTEGKLANNAVTSGKVKDRSLLAKDFKAGQLPAGPQGSQGMRGPQGLPGLQGAQGPQGPPGFVKTMVVQNDVAVPGGVSTIVVAGCPSGQYVTGGGYSQTDSLTDWVYSDGPSIQAGAGTTPTGWEVHVHNPGTLPLGVSVYAVCTAGSSP